jgi:hypothetical protein
MWVSDNRPMALSFLCLMARRLVGMLLGSLQSEHAKDVEIAVLRLWGAETRIRVVTRDSSDF